MKLIPLITLAAVLAITGCTKKEPKAAAPEATEKTAPNLITLSPASLAQMDLKTEPVIRGNIENTLKAAGRVSENLNLTAKVASTLPGRLTKLNYDLNERVKAGDVVGLVQTPELLGKPLELKAPINGAIVARKSTVGELVDPSTEIYTISEPTDLWVIAEIKERDIAAVKVGQEVRFTVLAYPGEEFHGKVVLLGNQVEADSRTLEVRVEVTNADGRLRPGMFAYVEITTKVTENVLVISDAALETDEENQVVFVELAPGKFEKRIVKPGMEQRGKVEVLDGVKEGEKVVTTGSFILKSELLKGELGEE